MSNIHQVPPEVTFDNFPEIDRRAYSEHLTNFLNSQAKNGYVINLNAEWGAGKTTFLHCWYNELKDDHPVIYFDAWKSDFTHDAMLALLEAFHSQLMCALTENKELLNKLLEGGKHFAKSTSWKLLAGFIKRQGGMEADDSLFSDISDELKELGLKHSDLTDSLKETFSAMLKQKQRVEGVDDFKTTLVQLSKAYFKVHKDRKAPVYVLIDELDRCRPTYAIEVIESIKHFFNTSNFVFVLATDTEQLQHSINAVYGQGFNSASYLSRFFDTTIVLEAPDLEQYVKLKLPELAEENEINKYSIKFIVEVFQLHKIDSLREIEKIFETIAIARSTQKSFKLFTLLILAILKRKFPLYFQQYLYEQKIPYQESDRSFKEVDSNFPIIHKQKFQFTTKTEISISYICHMCIHSIDHEILTDTYTWMTSSVSDGSFHGFLPYFSSLALLNSSKELAKKNDYLSILNFAGHIA
ncbi:hypothetical protein HB762_20270 [Vibrio campbellii]|uniref:KAP NTPase domain-containing protein n=1 Tax=Vibrio campbellii TaxID=680 RepID=A0ABY5IH57_9VIBR|nr:P-loop NTPase fold protein [Vibrio campbellii]UTZ33610.1 hypothetical protein HB762_20270 [Vibrio campbellii]